MDDARERKPGDPGSEPLSEAARDPILKNLRYPRKLGYHDKQKDDELFLEKD